ncbi:MAG: transglutaminase domain-containing protein [Desulfamplus sp.]|nr:transglutaminase domain-containing protein [Desulfamplus sp.]
MNKNQPKNKDDLTACLEPTYFMDYDIPDVAEFAQKQCNRGDNEKDRAVKLYYAVRDEIRYDPYDFKNDRANFKASSVLKKMSGYCVAKSILFAAAARSQGIPARLGFADVKNHLSTSRLRTLMQTDVFMYHGYVELLLNNNWVKATPAFNLTLCTHFNVKPLEFDGIHDSLFHEFDTKGNRHMEYLKDHGHFSDLPFDTILGTCMKTYPHFFAVTGNNATSCNGDYPANGNYPGSVKTGDFHQEAADENRRE